MNRLQKILAHATLPATRHLLLGALLGTLALGQLTGCASIVGSERQRLPIKSSPADAQILIIDEAGRTAYRGRTPDQVELDKSSGHYWGGKQFTVAISKRGYVTQRVKVDTHPNALYLGGNLIFGGLLGWLVVDPSNGKMYELSSDGIAVTLQKQAETAAAEEYAPLPPISESPLPEPAAGSAVSAPPGPPADPVASGTRARTDTAPPSIFVPERPPGGAGSWPTIPLQPLKPRPASPAKEVAGDAPRPEAEAPPEARPPRPYWPAPPPLPVSPSTAAPGSPWFA